jgi:hypothetical protein
MLNAKQTSIDIPHYRGTYYDLKKLFLWLLVITCVAIFFGFFITAVAYSSSISYCKNTTCFITDVQKIPKDGFVLCNATVVSNYDHYYSEEYFWNSSISQNCTLDKELDCYIVFNNRLDKNFKKLVIGIDCNNLNYWEYKVGFKVVLLSIFGFLLFCYAIVSYVVCLKNKENINDILADYDIVKLERFYVSDTFTTYIIYHEEHDRELGFIR